MTSVLDRVGDLEIAAVRDGVSLVDPSIFGSPDLDAHHGLVGADGMIALPIAAFVVHTHGVTALIDCGIGDRSVEWTPEGRRTQRLEGGALLDGLDAVGVTAADVDVVLLTHLHLDHNGWIWSDGAPTFPNARVRFGSPDWDALVDGTDGASADSMRRLAEYGDIEPIDGDGEVLPGISALATPGHTPGHTMFVLSSGGERAMILGDAISCPVQIEAPELEALADVDRRRGVETRERVLRELEGTDTLVSGPHFPGLEFGRVLRGQGRRYWS